MEQQTGLTKTLRVILVVLLITVIAYLGYYFLFKGVVRPTPEIVQQSQQVAPGQFSIEELKKIEVPEPGAKVSENVAVPKEVIKAGPKTESKLRIFEIKGENGQLSPNDLRAYQGDIVNIKLTAVDQDYDFRLEGYNIQMKANKGETKTIEFQALNLGIYNFYCSLCKTKERAVGRIVVVPK
jgi:heme/copper-type cytochrome/quinol oxidase subunit 2